MKNFAFAIALAGTFGPLSTPVYAGVQDSLGECYNILIAWCNDNSDHVNACANNVMDECDELHGANLVMDDPLPLAAKPADPKPKPKRAPQADPAPARDGSSRDTGRDSSGRDAAGGTPGRG